MATEESALMLLSPGSQLGPYEVVAPLGAGGMGEVYKARDTRLDRPVAIKVVQSAFSSRFANEARAIASLNHPHICTLYDVGPDYLVMEYIDGKPIQGPLPAADARRYALEIADALEAAHGRGIVHRDLKPANIMITPAGVKVLDFGLAKQLMRPDETQTIAGAVVGTLAYMPPEQAAGQSIDTRSDIFSFGAVLYEMLTGRRAFATVAALSEDPSLAAIPPDLSDVIRRCLKREPSQRFQSMGEVKAALSAGGTREGGSAIAVLSFVDMSPQRDQEYFCDGIAEEILNQLAGVQGLRVASRTSAFRFKGQNADIGEIGRHLKVSMVLEGSVRRAGDRLRVTAQLSSVDDGFQLWSERYDRTLADIFDIQEEIAASIVDRLKLKLNLGRRQTANPEAYQLYLEGRHHTYRLTESSLQRAMDCYRQAIGKDPEYAVAYAMLSQTLAICGFWGQVPGTALVDDALALAERSLALDPSLAFGYFARAQVRTGLQWNWAQGEADYLRAIELNPQESMFYYAYAGSVLLPLGRVAEALQRTQQAVSLEPAVAGNWTVTGFTLWIAGRHQDAIRHLERARGIDPSYAVSYFSLALLYVHAGRMDEALQLAAEMHRQTRLARAWALRALIHAARGETDPARAIAREMESSPERVPPFDLGLAWLAAGEFDRAVEAFERSAEGRDFWVVWLAVFPIFRPLHGHARFEALLEKVGLRKADPISSAETVLRSSPSLR